MIGRSLAVKKQLKITVVPFSGTSKLLSFCTGGKLLFIGDERAKKWELVGPQMLGL